MNYMNVLTIRFRTSITIYNCQRTAEEVRFKKIDSPCISYIGLPRNTHKWQVTWRQKEISTSGIGRRHSFTVYEQVRKAPYTPIPIRLYRYMACLYTVTRNLGANKYHHVLQLTLPSYWLTNVPIEEPHNISRCKVSIQSGDFEVIWKIRIQAFDKEIQRLALELVFDYEQIEMLVIRHPNPAPTPPPLIYKQLPK